MFDPTIPDLKGLRTLKAIQESGSLADAAVRLRLTPSALSHQLRELEDSAGSPLLVRKTRPPQFTRAGTRLLTLADRVLDALREAERDLGRLQAGSSGRLMLAIAMPHCFDWLVPVVSDFQANWQDVRVDFAASPDGDARELLRSGEADLVVTSAPVAETGIIRLRLFEYELLLLVATGHALATRSFAQPRDLAEETLLLPHRPEESQDLFRDFLLPAGVRPAQLRHVERDDLALQLVAGGHGVTALPNWTAGDELMRGRLRSVRLGRDGLWCTLSAVVREADIGRAYVRDFVMSSRDACLAHLLGIRPAAGDGA